MEHIKSYEGFIFESDMFSFNEADYEKSAETFAGLIKKYKTAKEMPKGSNKGPEVSQWLRDSGVAPGSPWCMAFIYGIFNEMSLALGIKNPLPKTAGVIAHWDSTDPSIRLNISEALKEPDKVKTGMIFIMHRAQSGKSNLGHTGIIISVDPVKKTFVSIEGNTNDMGSGEGDRVGINCRNFNDPLLIGFTDYFSKSRSPKFDEVLTKEVNTVTNDDQQRIKFKTPIGHTG